MQPFYKISPSALANYQFQKQLAESQYDKGKAETPEIAPEKIKPGAIIETEAMRIGTAVHSYLETGQQPDGYEIVNTLHLDQIRIELSKIENSESEKEVRGLLHIDTPFGIVRLSAIADVLDIDFGIDYKVSTSKKDAQEMFHSWQAFAYLEIFDVKAWHFVTLQAILDVENPKVIRNVLYNNQIRVPRTDWSRNQLVNGITEYLNVMQDYGFLDLLTH